MKFFITLAFAVFVATASAILPVLPVEQCPEGEQFTTCGTSCPEHCPVLNVLTGELETGLNRPCILNCKVGCQCQPGLVRDTKRNGQCVKREACTPVTPATPTCQLNEVFEECGTMCPEHCPVLNAKTGALETGANQPCVRMCKRGCACAPGFVRDLKRGGQCVEKFACQPPTAEIVETEAFADPEPKCAANEVFLTCGTACPATCPFRDTKTGLLNDGVPKACVHMCKIGCACAHGFVRDLKRNNQCVEKSLCSSP